MRSNSGSGKGKNNHRDPTMKEHEATRRRTASPTPHGHSDTAAEPARGERRRADRTPGT